MCVPVVQVGVVRVGLADRVVRMLVSVGFPVVHARGMLVVVVVVVIVTVVVQDLVVLVIVDVPLGQVEPDAEAHQSGGDRRECQRISQDEDRQDGHDEAGGQEGGPAYDTPWASSTTSRDQPSRPARLTGSRGL